MRYKTIEYSTILYPFIKIVSDLFQIEDLSKLHTLKDKEYKELFQVGMDSSTIFHTKFYDKYRAGWGEMQELYEDFIRYIVTEFCPEGFLYQKFPTFRVHLPDNIAVGKFHKDSDFGHPAGEINFVLPLTNSDDSASIWVESEEDKGDFTAMKLRMGELVTFNGNRLTHGNLINTTGNTRVSMDFRILPLSQYNKDQQNESITTKTKFIEGQYYKRYENNI